MKRRICDLSILFILAVVLFFLPPLWRTNDDVGMSMFAHGYGLANEASPNLLFSNVLWHHLLSLAPNFNGSTPYALAAMIVLFSCCIGFLTISGRLNKAKLSSYALLIFAVLGPLISPQFTINAGLCVVIGVLFLTLYERQHRKTDVVVGGLFIALGFLIRDHEALLVGFVALPLFLKPTLIKDRALQVCALCLIVFAVAAYATNKHAYSSLEWGEYTQLNIARALFTDFNVDKLVLKNPDLMNQEGVSKNDIRLVSHWFFEDKTIASADKLSRLAQGVSGQVIEDKMTWKKTVSGFRVFMQPTLLPLCAFGLLALLLNLNIRLAWSWLQLGLCVCILVVMGRPSVARIYEPVLILLCLYPVLFHAFKPWRSTVLHSTLGVLLLVSVFNTISTHAKKLSKAREYQQIVSSLELGTQPFIAWGSGLKYEYLFTPFPISDTDFTTLKIYGLGVSAYAPTSVAHHEREKNRSMIDRLLSDDGALIVISDAQRRMLATYCKEHFSKTLSWDLKRSLGNKMLATIRCR